jgi:hypothetical protein
MANEITSKEQQVIEAVFKGERRFMMDVIGKLVVWRVQIDEIVVEDNVTTIFVQAPRPRIRALDNALRNDGPADYYGTH